MFRLLIILTSLTLVKVSSQSNTTTLKPPSQAESIKIYFAFKITLKNKNFNFIL